MTHVDNIQGSLLLVSPCYALILDTVELVYILGALFPRGGPVQDSALTHLVRDGALTPQLSPHPPPLTPNPSPPTPHPQTFDRTPHPPPINATPR